ncbi:MAG: hypothetical protein E5X08_16805 [Mesorhizobium sp.]|nr:MAG: hypothetical protein E5X08_16805 [Mesorhizobium sp.]
MLAFLAGGTSAQLAAAMVDETGSGPLVFATSPTVALGSASTAVTQTPGDNSTKVATTAYVQAAIFATTTLPACRLATTAALPTATYANGASGVGATLTASANGALTVDGVAANLNDVILVKNQVPTFQNGIYTVTATGSAGAPFVLTRATYYNLSAEIDLGDQTFVTGGSTLGATTFVQNGKENPVIGTDPITFAQTAGVGAYTAGNGLVLAGTQFAIDTTIAADLTSAQTLSNKTLVTPALTGVPTAPTATGGTNSTQIATTAFVAAALAAGQLQKFYESPQQTITVGGTLTLAHGLGAKPKEYDVFLVCQTAEFGYSIGQEIKESMGLTTSNLGVTIVPDAANMNVKFGSSSPPVFSALNFSTGASVSLTNANWKMVVRAWL